MESYSYLVEYMGEDFHVLNDTTQQRISTADPIKAIVEDSKMHTKEIGPIVDSLEKANRRELAALRRGDAKRLVVKVNFKKQSVVKLLVSE